MYKHFFKRFFDFFISLIALVIISPIVLAVTLWLHFANKGAGAFFVQDRPGKDGKIFKVIKFKTMTDERDENGKLQYIYQRSSDENPNMKDDARVVLKYEEVMHITAMSMDGLVGSSIIASSKNSIAIALSAEEYGASFYKNGACPGGVLTHPGVIKNPEKVREYIINNYNKTGEIGIFDIYE